MKSWKSRLLMMLTILAAILAVSVPALADNMDVECGVDGGSCTVECDNDGETCEATLDWSSDQPEDVASDPLAEDCFPFCDAEWPW